MRNTFGTQPGPKQPRPNPVYLTYFAGTPGRSHLKAEVLLPSLPGRTGTRRQPPGSKPPPAATPGFDQRPLVLPPASQVTQQPLPSPLFSTSSSFILRFALLDVACWLAACLCCRLCWWCCCSCLHCLPIMSCLLIFCTVCV